MTQNLLYDWGINNKNVKNNKTLIIIVMLKPVLYIINRSIILFLILLLTGCSLYSHTNTKSKQTPPGQSKATLSITSDRGKDNVLVLMSLSGGGSRSAYFSAGVMLALEQAIKDTNILSEVDAISSVSGGSLPAAYYAISTDDDEPDLYGRKWNEKTVKSLMRRNYVVKWFGNWFWPVNIGKFWMTAYDRTDIMAQTFADNLFDTQPLGRDLKIGDLRQERPYLILNATNGSNSGEEFGSLFTFTQEHFDQIDSDINDYELARAVMATATFPAVFNYMTVKNYQSDEDSANQYVHIFDGGNVDNLGLVSLEKVIDKAIERNTNIDSVIVLLVDAYTGKSGVSKSKADTRGVLDFIIDTNFIDATDSLLSANRESILANFKRNLRRKLNSSGISLNKSMFYHVSFDDIQDVDLKNQLHAISTNFSIKKKNAALIDKAVDQLITADNFCLNAISDVIKGRAHSKHLVCDYKN